MTILQLLPSLQTLLQQNKDHGMVQKAATIYKRCSVMLLITLCIILFIPISVNAGSAILTTQVPVQCTIQVNIIGRGSIRIDGTSIYASGTLVIQRHKESVVEFLPGLGYQTASILLNGVDVTQDLRSRKLTLDGITFDSVLTVVFVKKSAVWPGSNPPTGDGIMDSAICCGMSMMGLLTLQNRKRKH